MQEKRPTKDEKSSFELTYDSANRKMLMRKVLYDDTTSYVTYNYNGARHHFCFGNNQSAGVNLYKRVDDSRIIRPYDSTAPYQDPEKITYRLGEQVCFNRMVVKFRINDEEGEGFNDYYIAYDANTAKFFSTPPYVTSGTGTQNLTFKALNKRRIMCYNTAVKSVRTGRY